MIGTHSFHIAGHFDIPRYILVSSIYVEIMYIQFIIKSIKKLK